MNKGAPNAGKPIEALLTKKTSARTKEGGGPTKGGQQCRSLGEGSRP